MKHRILPAILAALLLIGIMSVTAFSLTTVSSQTALLAALKKGADIKLSKSMVLTTGLVIEEGQTVSIDLNGKTLDRSLSTVSEGGSVITVKAGASLTIKDTSGTNSGIIKGGAAFNGGAICNYGTVVVEGGTFSDNKATDNTYGCGGAIYNGTSGNSHGHLTLKGGVFVHNRARNGGAVYNASGCTLDILQGSYIKTVGNLQKTIVDDVRITENVAASFGGGIFNGGKCTMKIKPYITGNTAGDRADDVYLATGKTIEMSGVLRAEAKMTLVAEGENPVVVTNYKKYNTADPKSFFKPADQDSVILLDTNGNVEMNNSAQTIVQVFKNETMTKREAYDTVSDAWNAAKSYGADNNARIEMTLGSNWNADTRFITPDNSKMVFDLNGHYLNRTRNGKQTNDGEVIYVGNGAILTIKDSNPESQGFDGIAGGVISGGASGNGAGGVHVGVGATFNMEGGTIYKCTTDKHGGAIFMKDKSTLNMKNCRIYFCQTVDSTDDCDGGGIYASKVDCSINLDNVIFQDCYSEDGGGAIYLNNYLSEMNISIKNCSFFGNITEDWGGAIYIFSTNNRINCRIDSCEFRNNRCGDYGGAISIGGYDSSQNQPPILIENCVFTENRSGNDGSAIEVGRPGVVLADCTITGNYSGSSGAVHVDEEYILSLAGKMIIKDNTAEYHGYNLDLDDTNSSKQDTMFESAGLAEGSEVYFYRLDNTSTVAKHITQYQTKYFIPETGTMTFNPEKTIETPLITASLFSNGSVLILSLFGVAAVAAVVIAVIVKKKKGGVPANENNA